MDKILAAGPSTGLFVGFQSGLVRIPLAGTYDITLRLQRESYTRADCISRLGIGQTGVLALNDAGVVGDRDTMYDPATLDLQPGMYRFLTAFGCWQTDATVGPGRLTIMIRRPGEAQFVPLPDGDVFHAPDER